MGSPLSMFFLGSTQAILDGTPVAFRSRRERALLAYLAVESGRYHSRSAIAGLIYPDMRTEDALRNIRLVLNRLRNELQENEREQPFLLIRRDGLQWNAESPYRLDVAEFLRLIAALPAEDVPLDERQVRHLTEAVALYRGAFLHGFEMEDSDLFEEWVQAWRERLHQLALNAMERLADVALANGHYDRARHYAQSQIALERWQEGAYRQLMTALMHQGQRRLALKQYETLARLLEEEVGVPPDPQTVALYEQIQAQPAVESAPLQAFIGQSRHHNLSPYYTPFFGRTAEVALLTNALKEPHRRLVAVVGEGGMGKSRLAVEVAYRLLPDFADGAWFVSFATLDGSVVEESAVVTLIANAIGLKFTDRGEPKTQLLNYLRMRRCLLVLDNFESADSAQNFLLELLAASSYLRLLVTTRHQLTLQAAYTLMLEGLPLPVTVTEARTTPSIQLLTERAERAVAGWSLRDTEIAEATALCELVYGMPLGIELTAVWVARSGVAAVRRELQRNLDQLAVTYQDIPPRHRSLRALFTASWELLTPQEKEVLAALTIFQESFSHEAAQAITEATDQVLSALVQKSLVRQVNQGRYRLHSVIRHFAAEHLPRNTRFARQHSTYYLQWMAPLDAQLYGASTPWAVSEIRQEWANVRAAWLWAVEHQGWNTLAASRRAVKHYIDITEQLREGRFLLGVAGNPLLNTPSTLSREEALLCALFLVQAAQFAVLTGEYEILEEYLTAAWRTIENQPLDPLSAEIHVRYFLVKAQHEQQVGNYLLALEWAKRAEPFLAIAQQPVLPSLVFIRIGSLSTILRHFEDAHRYLEQALVSTREHGDLENESRALQSIGTLQYFLDNIPEMRRYNLASLDLMMILQDESRAWAHFGNIGTTYLYEFAYEMAYEHHQRAAEGVMQVGFVEGMATMTFNRGRSARYLGLNEEAEQACTAALGWYTQTGGLWGQAVTNAFMAWFAAQRGEDEQATELIQTAVAIARTTQLPQAYYFVLPIFGKILQKQGDLEGASAAFTETVEWCDKIQDAQSRLDALAGIAEISLLQGDVAQALEKVNEILAGIEAGQLNRADEPIGVYLVCIRILTGLGDARAPQLLQEARALLEKQSTMITDPSFRAAFLQRPAHQQLTAIVVDS